MKSPRCLQLAMTHTEIINVTVWGSIINQLCKEKAGPAHALHSHPPGTLDRNAQLGLAQGTPLRFLTDSNKLPGSSGKGY